MPTRAPQSSSLPARSRRSRLLGSIVLALALVAATLVVGTPATQAQSYTIYVAPDGDDANPGTRARPKYSIVAAMLELPDGGDILMRGGEYYYDNSQSGLWLGGTARRPLVVKSASGERASITSAPGAFCVLALGDYTRIRNLDCTGYGGISVYEASHIYVYGNHVHDITGDRLQGIIVSGGDENFRDITVRRNTVRRVPQTGIAVGTTRVNAVRDVVVQHNKVRQAGYQFRNNTAQQGGWGSGISVIGADDARLTDNDVRRTYGEGINCPLSNNCRVRRNVVADAWNVAYYGDNTSNSVFEDNVAKWTGDPRFTRDYGFGSWPLSGVVFANETGWYQGPGNPTDGNIVRNNVMINVFAGVSFLIEGSSAGLTNTLFANNTIVDAQCGFDLRYNVNNSGNEIYNNLVRVNRGGWGNCHSAHGMRFRNNLFTRGDGDQAAHGSNVLAAARFVGGGYLRPSSYRLSSNSPAIDAGRNVAEVHDDKRGDSRPQGDGHDIGAFEY